ncbi:MAG: efflux RND transporter periplasmic adaptor subunit [Candidatus Omnitrophica bacterium]|nr:efflux RND transporter periplasmic adaptor subunit [Candidatus Omnitrophota bacterium]
MIQSVRTAGASALPAESGLTGPERDGAKANARADGRVASDPNRSTKVRRRRPRGHVAVKVIAVLGSAALLALVATQRRWRDREAVPEITATVVRAELPITVTERGELESSKTVDVRCEVEGEQIKIIEIVPEGTRVREGDLVIRFDTDKLARSYAEQEVKWRTAEAKAKGADEDLAVAKNKAASEIAKAKLTLKLAQIDLRKYREGDYLQEKRGIEGEILIAEEELKRARDRVVYSERLHKKGYVSAGELEADRVGETKTKNTLDVAKEKLRVLEQFTRERTEAELTANAEEAVREQERVARSQASTIAKAESDFGVARDTTAIEKAQLDRLKQQLDRCTVRAPRDGIVVYNKDRPWDQSSRIQLGGVVHFQQRLFSLPDLAALQVKVRIHESAVKKLGEGQRAEVRVDAYPNRVLSGTVEKVATLADSRGFWDQRGVKEYETIVRLSNVPTDAGLKPGMTAEVKILVDHLSDVLVVPVQAVAEHLGQHVSYVVTNGTVEPRAVSVGENNDQFIQITSGLSDGERVALDARARVEAAAETANEQPKNAANTSAHRKEQVNAGEAF